MKQNIDKKKDSNYVKPELVVYGNFSEITKLTGGGTLMDGTYPRDLPIFS